MDNSHREQSIQVQTNIRDESLGIHGTNNDMSGSVHAFIRILDHHGPLRPKDLDYRGSTYNVQVTRSDGSSTWEPLYSGAKRGAYHTDPAAVATYAKANHLLGLADWDLPGIKEIARAQDRSTHNISEIRHDR